MKVVLNAQKLYALIVAYMLSFLALLNLVNAILNQIGLYTVFDTVILYGLLVGFIGLGVVVSIADGMALRLDDALLIGFLAFSFLLSGLMHPENQKYLFTSLLDYGKNPIYVTFIYSLPGFYFIRRLRNYDYFRHFMAAFSYAVVMMSAIVFFAVKKSSALQYMTFSYNMLTQLLYLCLYPAKKRRIAHYAVVAAGVYVFIVGGARGAMISFVLTLGLSYFFKNNSTKKSVLTCLAMVVGGIVFASFKNTIFLFLAEVLDYFSINSRTFKLLLNGELLNDIHRMRLYSKTLSNTGILGAGVKSEWVLLGNYPHNLFIELWYHYGWVLGSVLNIAICACVVYTLRKRNRPEAAFIVLMLPCGFLKLMLTGSYLNQEPAFYVLLGLCMNSIMRGTRYAYSNDQYGIRSWQYR